MTNKVFTKKGKAKDIVTDIKAQRSKAEKIQQLKDKGLDVDELKKLTLEEFDKIYTQFTTLTKKLDTNREEFLNQFESLTTRWSFEEIFIFCIDILNAHLITLADSQGVKLEVQDIFPVLYEDIYNKCISVVKDKYLEE